MMAKFCTQTHDDDGFYVYRGRRYENNIFLKLHACSPTLLLRCAGWARTSWLAA